VFTEKMEWIEFNPYWSVPPSIAVNEYLPKLKNGSGILGAQNIRVFAGAGEVSAASVDWASLGKGRFPYTLRQDPGEGNALGRVKFVFPNSYNVYMHDTPSKSKFEAAQRYFSHGCLRLRNPLKLAEIILQSEGWTRARIDAAVATGKNTVVKLKTQIPVYVVYLTAFANKDGSIHFREDVYGNDKILAAALARVKGR
jgi:murein L,D-transpeptidase YcbB/YkuD